LDNRHTAKTGGDFFRRSRAAERRKNGVLSFTAWDVNKNHHTVDGRNPAPVDMVNIPLFARFYTTQVVQDFFHQEYGMGEPQFSRKWLISADSEGFLESYS